MLRITMRKDSSSLTFQLEGRLAGLWVKELEDCWQNALAAPRSPVVRFDLTGVTYVDAAGKKFLAARHLDGAEFAACGCLMKAVVAEITNAPVPDCGHSENEFQK